MRSLEPGHKDFLVLAGLNLGGIGVLQEQLYCFPEIGSRLLDRLSLAGDIQLRTERYEEVAFPFQNRSEAALGHLDSPTPPHPKAPPGSPARRVPGGRGTPRRTAAGRGRRGG